MSSLSPPDLMGTPLFRTPAKILTPAVGKDTGRPATSGSVSQEQRYAALNQEAEVINELRDIDLLPLLLDLIESLKLGKITPKDFGNAAGRIRVRLARCKALVNQIEGLTESPEVGIEKMKDLEKRMESKRAVLADFNAKAGKLFGSESEPKEDRDVTMS